MNQTVVYISKNFVKTTPSSSTNIYLPIANPLTLLCLSWLGSAGFANKITIHNGNIIIKVTYIVQKHSPVSLELKKSLNTRVGELCVDNGFLQIISSDHLSLFCHKKKNYEYRISSYNCRGNYSFLNSSSEETNQVFISLM